jgi:hypothetical protein
LIADVVEKIRGRTNNTKIINQTYLIGACIHALKLGKKEDWINSFKKVNMHPDFCMPFPEWIEKIQSIVASGDEFYHGRANFFDATPAVWKNMDCETRHIVISKIKRFHVHSKEDPWNKNNVLELAEVVALEDVIKMRACYHLYKRDLSILVEPPPVVEVPTTTVNTIDTYAGFCWKPTAMLNDYVASMERDAAGKLVKPPSEEMQDKLFRHISNHVARHHNQRSVGFDQSYSLRCVARFHLR